MSTTRRPGSQLAPIYMATVIGMAPRTHRRARGTRERTVPVFVEVRPEAKFRLDEIQAATGAPKWAIVEALLENVELDAHGRPVFWPESTNPQEALDIPA